MRWLIALALILAGPSAQAQFTIPNLADAASADQAEIDSKDIEILVAGVSGTGVVSGCAVTAQGSPDMTLAVASGSVRVGVTIASVSSGNVTITTAHATLARFDFVVVNSSGTKSVTAGTASSNPVFPAIPASSLVLAAIYVPAADTAIQTNQIVDKRVVLASTSISLGLTVEVVTATKTTTAGESGELYANTGDTDGSTITLLNDPTLGAYWRFAVDAAQTQTVQPSSGETLYLGGSTCATLASSTPGSTLMVVAITAGSGAKFMATSMTGSWICS